MYDLLIITIFVIIFSLLHSKYNNRNKTDKYYIFALSEISIILSYFMIMWVKNEFRTKNFRHTLL